MKAVYATVVLIVICLVTALFLYGCTAPPEPKIVTQTVEKAVPVPCNPQLPPRPTLMGKNDVKAALAAAPSLDDRVKIVATQLLLYIGWVPVVEAALQGCKDIK